LQTLHHGVVGEVNDHGLALSVFVRDVDFCIVAAIIGGLVDDVVAIGVGAVAVKLMSQLVEAVVGTLV
jgi:hypothetical protein